MYYQLPSTRQPITFFFAGRGRSQVPLADPMGHGLVGSLDPPRQPQLTAVGWSYSCGIRMIRLKYLRNWTLENTHVARRLKKTMWIHYLVKNAYYG